jgi:tetratricopeptide (TPR) repeat protein
MRRYAAGLLALFAFLSCGSCGSDRMTYKEDLQRILDTSKNPLEMKGRLLELDQRVPDKAVVKINLGILCLTLGETEEAGVYLKRAHELKRANLTADERYLLLSGLAEYSYKSERLEEARGFAQEALEIDAADRLGERLIIARVAYRQGKLEKAYESFREVWGNDRKYMNKEDYDVFFVLLLNGEEWTEAYQVLQAYLEKFGYEYGMGVKTSALLEKAGRINASILAAFTDLRYAQFRGMISPGDVGENLEELGRKLRSAAWPNENRGEQVLFGLQRVLEERWGEAGKVFGELAGATDQSSPLVRHWFLVVQMENGNSESLAAYIEEESTFRGFPEYYYRLWRTLKSRQASYSLAKAKPVLERAAYFSRGTTYGLESRRELGRLMGLTPADSTRVLVGNELKELEQKFQSTGELQYIEPMLQALAIENNDYTSLTEAALRGLAAGFPDLRTYLVSRREKAVGNLKLRLDNLLN